MFLNRLFFFFLCTAFFFSASCREGGKNKAVKVGFVEAFEDETIAAARKGFFDALAQEGFSEENGTLDLVYRNAQGDQAILSQIVSFMASQQLDLIGTSTTLSTLSVVQRIHDVPVFMTVTATPKILGIEDQAGRAPSNLFGAAEDLSYIDTSFAIIQDIVRKKSDGTLIIGMVYNQAEPQSVDAFNRLNKLAKREKVDLVALPLNNSADAQLVVKALLNKKIDVFFANPDNTVFAAFETILKNCEANGIPVFTSEEGLVKRGAVAAYGADIYAWGYQSGLDAAQYLKNGSTDGLEIYLLEKRRRVYNPGAAAKFGFELPKNFESIVAQ